MDHTKSYSRRLLMKGRMESASRPRLSGKVSAELTKGASVRRNGKMILTSVRRLALFASDLCTQTCPFRLALLGTSLRVRGKRTTKEERHYSFTETKNSAFFQTEFFYFYSFVMVFPFFCFRYTMRTDISAGDTPEIRDACPSDTGRILSNFCRASIEIPSRFK